MKAPDRPLLYLEPMCGLCNRLRVIDGAASLAAVLGARVEVLWFVNHDVACRFEDLYAPIESEVRFRNFRLPRRLELVAKRMIHFAARRLCAGYMLQFEAENLARAGHDFTPFVRRGRTYLKTWSRFHATAKPSHRFHPVPHLAALIQSFPADFERVVGVHIRRTDCVDAIGSSPTEKFIAAMRQELHADPGTQFFLATDDPAEEEHLRHLFPGKILTYQKRTRARCEREGIEDAVIDLHLLGRCRSVLGSQGSSFSETALELCRAGGRFVT